MSLLINSSRRRKLLFAAAAVTAGGYASYRIYTSSAFARRRKRLLQLLSTLSFCCDAVSQSAESMSILSSDFKSFLLSDDDSVPQSLKQVFKIGQTEEFQDSVTVLSAALTRGLLRGVNAKQRKEGHVRGHGQGRGQPVKPGFQAWQVKDADAGSEDVACREIREVCFTDKRHEHPRSHGREHDKERSILSNAEKGVSDCPEWEIKSYSSGSDMCLRRSRKVGIVLDRSRRGKPSEDLLDKLLSKLFSEPGVGFASAVAGTLARNLVLSLFEAARKQSSSTQDPSSANSPHRASETTEERTPSYAKVIDVISTKSCRMLIAECIQTFIATAVTVYMDKTKDVNFYDNMVAGITNPSHRDPMKDMLTSVCNSAVETLVKTSYGVMVAEDNGQNGLTDSHQQSGKNQWGIQECSALCMQGQLPSSMEVYGGEANCSRMEDLTSDEQSYSQATSIANTRVSIGRSQGNSTGGVQSFIDGVSKTLAIPSNRKLVVDVAGTMTSEAVRSFVDVVVNTASSHIGSKMHGSWDRVKSCVSGQQGLQLQERSRDMAAKAFILASVCLAICLHMLTGYQILQKL